MSDGEYVPSSDADSDASSMDAVAASGDDEVVLAVCTSSTSDLRRRRRKRRRRTVSSAVIPVLVDMDTSAEEVPGHKQFKTFRGIWKYKISWEEVRSRKLRYRVVVTPQGPSSTPALFPFQSFSTSASTPALPASPVPSTFSSNGSVVDSVPTPTPQHSIGSHIPSRRLFQQLLSFCFEFAWLLGESDRCIGLPGLLLLLQCCVVSQRLVSFTGLLHGLPCFF